MQSINYLLSVRAFDSLLSRNVSRCLAACCASTLISAVKGYSTSAVHGSKSFRKQGLCAQAVSTSTSSLPEYHPRQAFLAASRHSLLLSSTPQFLTAATWLDPRVARFSRGLQTSSVLQTAVAEEISGRDLDSEAETAANAEHSACSTSVPAADQSADPVPDANQLCAQWLANFQRLKEYKQTYGDCLVPAPYWEEPELGQWVREQRAAAAGAPGGIRPRGPVTLEPERKRLLDSLGFVWKVDMPVIQWEFNYHELRRYKEEYGNIDVPFKWKDATYAFNNHFARWFHMQPGLFSQRRLSVNQVKKLKLVGYDMLEATGEDIPAATYADEYEKLNSKDRRNEFEIMFATLTEWKDTYRTTLVPKQVWDNPVLGMWVHRLRRDFANNRLPQWQIDKLDTLQFAWKVDQISAKWHHNLHEARRYKVLHGTANIPADYTNPDELGFVEASRWLQRCAQHFNKDRLTVTREWLLRNILDIKFVRSYNKEGIMQPGAKGKALGRKKGPRPNVVEKALDLDRPRRKTFAIDGDLQ